MKQAYAGKTTALLEYLHTFLAYGTEHGTVQRAFKVMLVVGTLLTLINHGQDFVSGVFSWHWIVPMVLTYLVPFCVATYGEVQEKCSARERHRPPVSSMRKILADAPIAPRVPHPEEPREWDHVSRTGTVRREEQDGKQFRQQCGSPRPLKSQPDAMCSGAIKQII